MFHNAGFSKRSLAMTAIAFSACITSSVHACSPDAYTGTVCITAGNYCPRNTAEANGALLPITGNEALYSLLGTTYGGDGRTNFRIPDLRGRSIVGWGTGPGLTGVNPGEYRGDEYLVQSIAQMPSHTHAAAVTGGGGGPLDVTLSVATNSGGNEPRDGYLLGAGGTGQGQAAIYVAPSSVSGTVSLGGVSVTGGGSGPFAVTVDETGGGQAMPNIPPQLGMRVCMVIDGIYPPRN